jgi:acyl transferase domain-containing protein/NADPH:quinone reductase-like Zn-dependent oxidoreductase
MLERGFILPNYDFKQPNTKIPWKEWNLKVPTGQRPWPRGKKYVSVNNFGFGGTNGHIVLEANPFRGQKTASSGEESPENTAGQGRKLYVLTANDKTALSQLMKNIVIYLEQRPEIFQMDLMSNIAYTLGQRRSLLQWRVAIAAQNSFELIEALNGEKCTLGKEIEPLRIGFIFTGQGAQWHAMGRELYEQYPVFKRSLDFADRCLAALGAEWSLIGMFSHTSCTLFYVANDLFLEELSKDAKSSMVGEAHLSQPSCTAVQLALVDLFRTWGIRPTAVAGHSSGEIGAAYAAGIITFETAMAVAYHRGRLIPILKQNFPALQGRMMAVGGSKDEVAPLIEALTEKEVRIACFNSPSSLTISGDEPALAELERMVEAKQMFNRRLLVDVAYHSHHMNLVAKDYRASIAKLTPPKPTSVRFHSSLYGHLVDGTQLHPNYWVDNLTCPVRFSEALQSMLEPVGDHKTGVNMLIELGPHSALQGPIKQILKAVGGPAAKIPYASALVRKKDAVESAMDVAASLFAKGATLNFAAINFAKTTKAPTLLTDLPRYPWNYSTRYWQESRMTQMHKHRPHARSDMIGTLANYSNDLEPTWRNIVRLDDLPWLQHHKIQGLTIFPMAGFVAMALEAAGQRAATEDVQFDRFDLRDVSIIKPLVLSDKDTEMTITLRPHQESSLVASEAWDEFRICSWSHDNAWTEHCVGLISTVSKDVDNFDQEAVLGDGEELTRTTTLCISETSAASVSPSALYDSLAELGVAYGPAFQGISNCHAADNCALGDISVPDIAKDMPNHHMTDSILHPAVLESLIEMYWPILGAGGPGVDTIYLPSAMHQMSVSRSVSALAKEPGSTLRAYCKADFHPGQPKPSLVDLVATESADPRQPLISIRGLTVSPIVDGATQLEASVARELCYKLEWEPILEPLPQEHKTNGYSNGANGSDHGAAQLSSDTEVVIIHEASDFQQLVAHGVANALERTTGRLPEVGSLSGVSVAGKTLVFLSELHRPYLATLSPTEFSALQKVLTAVQGVLWIVRGAYAASANPEANMVTGLSRTIRSETALKFATLDLDAEFPLSESDTAKAIVKVFTAAFGPGSSATSEQEFMERRRAFFTPRIVHDQEMDDFVKKQTNPSTLEPSRFGEGGRQLKMDMSTPGALDTIHFVDDAISEEPLAADQVEIEVRAIGLNYRDAMAAKGQVPASEAGIEVSGVVVTVGSGVSNLCVGDPVAALAAGAFATTVRTSCNKAFKVPLDMPFEAAATLPLAYCTAYYSLIDIGRLSDGESVLIHGAAGAVGQAAITLAHMVGAEVFATVSSSEKKELLMREYGLPSDHIFYSRSTSFGRAVLKATRENGVDVILNSLAGEFLRESWSCLSKFGRFMDIGKRDQVVKSRVDISHVDSNASFISVDLLAVATQRPKVIKRVVSDVGRLLKYGKIRPIQPVTAFPLSQVDAALKSLQTTRVQGKLVVVPHKDDIVKVPDPRPSSQCFFGVPLTMSVRQRLQRRRPTCYGPTPPISSLEVLVG